MNFASLNSSFSPRCSTKAYTLIELLVTVTIIGILTALSTAVVQQCIEAAHKAKCASNLRQILIANGVYLADNSNVFPNRGDSWLNYGAVAESLLPYVNNDYSIFLCPSNKGGLPSTMQFPSDPSRYCDYEFNSELANFDGVPSTRSMNGVTSAPQAAYVYDHPYWSDPMRPHVGGVNVGYLDGHVAFLTDAQMALSGPLQGAFYNLGQIY